MDKMLKRIVIIMSLVGTLALSVLASTSTIRTEDLILSLTIPDSYTVLNENTADDDPFLEMIGMSKNEMLTYFAENNLYLDCFPDDGSEEIAVSIVDLNMDDYNFDLFSVSELNEMASSIADVIVGAGFNVDECGIYEGTQANFLRVSGYYEETDMLHIIYMTIINGNSITITLGSYLGEITTEQETTMEAIINSVQFASTAAADPAVYVKSFVYTDIKTGVSFTVPENWEQREFSKERQFLDVKFASLENEGTTIIYGSNDLWELLSDSEKLAIERSDIDQHFNKNNIASVIGLIVDDGNISTVEYNGIEYYKINSTVTNNDYGFPITISTTFIIHLENGWLYLFELAESPSSDLSADFEQLLESVHYPAVMSSTGSEKNAALVDDGQNTLNSDSNNRYDNSVAAQSDGISAAIAILTSVIIIAAIAVLTIILRKKNKKRTSNFSSSSESMMICRNCGSVLPNDSAFCHVCGTFVDRGRE